MEEVQNKIKDLAPKVSFHTLGCRLNAAETGSLAQGFKDRGYKIVEFGDPSDVVFINTCTVTDKADSSCRNLIRKAKKSSPEGKIVVAGCYAQMEPEAVRSMQGVDLILGNSQKYKVFDYLSSEEEQVIKVDQTNEFWGAHTTLSDCHTRAFLKIQDGCNYICSFCIIPHARGRSRCISVDEATNQAKKLIADGFLEIVLTGVNIGEYQGKNGESLEILIAALLKLKGLKRLRLSSVEPNTITKNLLSLLREGRVYMPHFHIPLQSGDDEILKAMRRKYTTSQYQDILYSIKEQFPNASIGADIMAGFPGESVSQFENTFQFLRKTPVTHFHVFPYSKRKLTLASKMENQIPHGEKKERVSSLIKLGQAKLWAFSEEQKSSVHEVLFEKKEGERFYTGYTENFLKVKVESDANLQNKILPVKITHVHLEHLDASIIH